MTVTVGWTSRGPGTNPFVHGATIHLSQSGTMLLAQPIDAPLITGTSSSVFALGWESVLPVCVETGLDNGPVAYVNGFAGGMNCCSVVRVYYPQPGGAYGEADHAFARSATTITVVDGEGVIESGNPDFQGTFDCEACSINPLQVMSAVTGTFVDITRQFPTLIAADAAQASALLQSNPSDPYGVLPAYVADECELGQQSQAYAMMDSMAASGALSSPQDESSTAAYIAAVKALLVKDGYCT